MIHYFSEDIDFNLASPRIVKQWLKTVAKGAEYQIQQLNIVFCSDAFLYQINTTYLQHDTFTDIITFNYSNIAHKLVADLYISVERVRENADAFRVSFNHELHRVMVHGLLHLMGWNDSTPEEETDMRSKEEECLAMLWKNNEGASLLSASIGQRGRF